MGWDAGLVVYQISAVFSGFLLVFFRLALSFSSFLNQFFSIFVLKTSEGRNKMHQSVVT